ncbi:hypothetical protein C7399_109183 [Paraburkholderia tropica]|uniref:Uncharacterized protein n=1 Tax=Paraburkholderia tropica TaxID=92647 RepID=A0ABX5MNP0_9BURK|nr:hypothetical protein [Paraburkholderia tropica]PXX15848.1 hypothetical protein C7400_109183 [Paraburkholderia tropica]PZW82107.1 hypothetical protein C7399_109183 [Paraburkholderia tropica]
MTLPASYPLSMSQIATELGLSLPLSLTHAWVLALAGKTAAPISFGDLLGKSGQANAIAYVNSNGFAVAPLFSAAFFDVVLIEADNPGNSCTLYTQGNTLPALYRGRVLVTNHTTGLSAVLNYTGVSSGPWSTTVAPSNLFAKSSGATANSITIQPST